LGLTWARSRWAELGVRSCWDGTLGSEAAKLVALILVPNLLGFFLWAKVLGLSLGEKLLGLNVGAKVMGLVWGVKMLELSLGAVCWDCAWVRRVWG